MNNYDVLQELWDVAKSDTSDPTMKARIIGVESQFRTSHYFFGVHLGELILRHTDNLSKTLQSSTISASEGASAAAMTTTTLEGLRNEEHFESFWATILLHRTDFNVDKPQLPRRRKVPWRLETGLAPAEFPADSKSIYRRQYYEALDLVVTSIKQRFDQPGFRIHRNLEDLLLRCVRRQPWEDIFGVVAGFFRDDLDADKLKLHLGILCSTYPRDKEHVSLTDIRKYLQQLSNGERQLISEVVLLTELVLVMPSTNAVSERSFSALRRLKTYLRGTMKQSRLNHLLLLHVHKDLTDSLSLVAIADAFVGSNEHRMSIFGRFSSRA